MGHSQKKTLQRYEAVMRLNLTMKRREGKTTRRDSFGARLLAVGLLSQSAQEAAHIHGAEGVKDLVAWLAKRKMPGGSDLSRCEENP